MKSWLAAAMLGLVLGTSGCGVRGRAAELYPHLTKYGGREVKAVDFQGGEPLGRDSLLTIIETHPSHCSILGIPICVPFTTVGKQIHYFNLQQLHEDVIRLASFYRYSGYFGTTVSPLVRERDDDVEVTFQIRRGDEIKLDSLTVSGTDTIFSADSIAATLPLKPGQTFHFGQFTASADRLMRAMQARGHAYAQVLRNYAVDTVRNRAVASLEAIPGPRVIVDSIAISGAENLGRKSALRQLTFREGDVLSAARLIESQRNFLSLELVQLASVSIAPDSLDSTPGDSTRATVLVNIAETKVHQADVAVGYGTIACMRTDANYVNRSFTGGARKLSVNASVSKIGLGGATSVGVGQSLCGAFAADTFEHTLDYRLAADFVQPYFLSPRNHLTLSAYVERQSEPTVFQRSAEGGRVLLNRRLAPRSILSGGFHVEYGSTLAAPAIFCAALMSCVPDDIEELSRARWRNSVGLNFLQDRTDISLDPTSGSVLRAGLAWAPPWLLSDVTFMRFTAETSVYREVRPGWIAAGSLRLGNFFKTASLTRTSNFLPPEERFYAGGANTVRGFDRNALGRGVYVIDDTKVDTITGKIVPRDDKKEGRFVPIGGTALGIMNAELRIPSPLFPRRMRLAFFIDAGAVDNGNVWNMAFREWRLTPGAGIRMASPVGPARVDVAYNPYNKPMGPLYRIEDDGSLMRVRDDYRPKPPTFFGRFNIQLSVGQAF